VLGGGAGLQMQAKLISPELAPSSCCTIHPAGMLILLLYMVPRQHSMHKTAGYTTDRTPARYLVLAGCSSVACQSYPSCQLHIPMHHCACTTQDKVHKRTQGTESSLIMSLVKGLVANLHRQAVIVAAGSDLADSPQLVAAAATVV
jgi:hypothetical protein